MEAQQPSLVSGWIHHIDISERIRKHLLKHGNSHSPFFSTALGQEEEIIS